MKILVFFMGISSLLLAFQKQFFFYHLNMKKYPKSILNNFVIFKGWGWF
jgi:hypothetical protein